MADRPMIEAALSFAFQAHAGTFRDGDSPLPYVTHCVDVLNTLRYVGAVEEECILLAGVLHDTLEWGDCEPDQIESAFGPEVLGLVRELTRREPDPALKDTLPKAEWRALRTQLLLEDISAMSPAAKAIKLADRISNLRAGLITRSPKSLDRYQRQTWSLLDAIPVETNPRLHTELSRLAR